MFVETFLKGRIFLNYMGRIKTALVKRITQELVEKHRQDFKKTFEENKPLVGKYTDITSKKMRNVIAGYVTRLMNAKE